MTVYSEPGNDTQEGDPTVGEIEDLLAKPSIIYDAWEDDDKRD